MDDLSNVLKQVFDAHMSSVFTAVPGKVLKYEYSTKTVEVLPLVKMSFESGEVKSFPVLTNVQVLFAGTNRAVIQYDLAKNDCGLVIFSSQSLENWTISQNGEEVEPGDSRKFSLTDAFFIPGLFPPKTPGVVGKGTGLEMIYNNAKIWITTAGNIEMNGNDRHLVTYEQLEAAKEEFMEQLNSHTHGGVLAGGANTAAPNTMTFNITASKARTLYTGG